MRELREKVMTGFNNPAANWNQRYSSDEYIFGTEANHFLQGAVSHLKPGMRALVIADGEGRNGVWLAKQDLNVDAFDISDVAIEKAKKLAKTNEVNVSFNICDCESWDWQAERYDAVIAIFIQFADPVTRAALFANIMKTMKPGGILIVQGYTPKQLDYKTGGPPLIDHLYTEALLRDAFKELHIEQLVSYEKFLTEGSQHHGMSALVGLIATKPASSPQSLQSQSLK